MNTSRMPLTTSAAHPSQGAVRLSLCSLLAALGIILCTTWSAAQWVATVFSGDMYKVGRRMAATTGSPEAEEHIAVDPKDPKNLVAATMDLSRKILGSKLETKTIRYAFSAAGGDAGSWKDAFVNVVDKLGILRTGDGRFWFNVADPSVAIDDRKNVYLAQVYQDYKPNQGPELKGTSGIYVSMQAFDKLADPGFAEGKNQTVAVFPPDLDPSKKIMEDKPWIAVDSCAGGVHVAWTHIENRGTDSETSQIYYANSEDQGKNWSEVVKISAGDAKFGRSGAQVAAGKGCGEVVVVWEETTTTADPGKLFESQIFMSVSDDHGAVFGAPRKISDKFLSVFGTLPGVSYKVNAFPAMTVSPKDGSIAVVYSAAMNNSKANPITEINFIIGSGGNPFTKPQVINGELKGEHFFPALTADANGVFHICWLDTRRSFDADHPEGDNHKLDVFATYTKDNGKTFGKNEKVTSAILDVGDASFIGDYIGIAAGGGFAHPVWSDIQAVGQGQIGTLRTATLTLP